ncbi:MAG TPA: YciI family protein [Cyclobacteriaceae bacterium]|nr:YciI family protein [Cyclobacteriaceae bacterium]
MKEFLLIYRREAVAGSLQQMSPEQLQNMMKPWQDWMGSLAAQNKLVDKGFRLEGDGNVVKPDSIVTNGPYVETKEAVGGYSIIKAKDLKEAGELAKGCPILKVGGSVEVRAIIAMD